MTAASQQRTVNRNPLDFQRAIDQSAASILIADVEGIITYVNKGFTALTGYTADDIIGKMWHIFDVDDPSDETYSTIRETLSNGDTWHGSLAGRHKDGSAPQHTMTLSPIYNAAGDLTHYTALARLDNSAEDSTTPLLDANTRYETVVRAMAEGIVFQAASGEIITCNTRAEEILGLTAAQMQGKTSIDPHWRAVHEDGTPFPGEEHPAMVTLQTGEAQRDVIMGVHKPNGVLTWISVNSEPLFSDVNDSPYAVVTSFHDVTAQRHAHEQALQQAVEQEQMRVLMDFIESVSHEFHTPLAIIETSTYLMERRSELDPKHLTRIRRQSRLISRLVDMMLTMTRLDSRVDMRQYVMSPFELLRTLQETIQSKADEENLTFDVEIDAAFEDQRIVGDVQYLNMAINQIIDNALAYTPAGGSITVLGSVAGDGGSLISIIDTGIGIAPDDQAHIFKRFFRADDAHTTPGFGLGLAIVKRIMQAHGGHISVSSTLGEGSTFRLWLPSLPTDVD